jgi:hypothetical protein
MTDKVFGSLAVRLAVATVAAGLFVGCEKSETTPADSAKSAADSAKSAASDASKSANDAATSAADAGKSAADAGGAAATNAAHSAGEAGKSAADAAGAAASNAAATVSGDKGAAAAAPADATAASTEAQAKATDLLTQVTTYGKENKMDLAEKALAELDKLKPQLPAEYASKIDGAHKMFDAAKSGKGLGELKDNLLGK